MPAPITTISASSERSRSGAFATLTSIQSDRVFFVGDVRGPPKTRSFKPCRVPALRQPVSFWNRCKAHRGTPAVLLHYPALGEANPNADFFLFFGCGQRTHWIVPVRGKWARTGWHAGRVVANGRHSPIQT